MLTIKQVETTSTGVETVALRPLEYGDRAPLLEIFAGLSDRSRWQRFLTPKTRLTETDLRQLTAVDDHDHVALLAVTATDDCPVGIARFIRDPRHPDSADVAVAVVDAWQSRGIGTMLTDALARRAVEVGVRRFTLMMASDNRAARRLAHHGAQVSRLDVYSGTLELAILLRAGEAQARTGVARPIRSIQDAVRVLHTAAKAGQFIPPHEMRRYSVRRSGTSGRVK